MNTWDRDTDNALAVVIPAADSTDSVVAGRARDGSATAWKRDTGNFGTAMNGDLELSSVSQDQSIPPPGVAFIQMYHSQKPGRWSKRFISLVGETGQVLSSKKSDAGRLASWSASGKGVSSSNDFQSLCHLSDYDIYRPTEAEMRKHIKPPKKFCFAVKSQQRTTVFLNTENCVHFFCLDDPGLAREFYGHVFAWRSWYLVNRKLSLASPSLPTAADIRQQRQLTIRTDQSPSCDTSKIDPTARRPPDMGLRAKGDENNSSTQRMFNGNEFAIGSLLGSAYDDRRNLEPAKQSEANGLAPDVGMSRMGPFTDGSLLDNERSLSVAPSTAISSPTPASAAVATSRHEPSSWIPSATEHSARDHNHQPSRRPIAASRPSSSSSTSQQQSVYLPAGSAVVKTPPASMYRGRQQYVDRDISKERQQSMRRTASHTSSFRHEQQHPKMPAPLIDLTPKFQEAPQWSKEHRGRGVRAPPGTTHLVDLATRPNGGGVYGTLEPIFSDATLLRRDATDSTPPARYRKARAQTMTSASAAAAAAATTFTRSHHTVHHSSRTRDPPPVPLLSRIPPHPPSAHDAANASHERATTPTRY